VVFGEEFLKLLGRSHLLCKASECGVDADLSFYGLDNRPNHVNTP